MIKRKLIILLSLLLWVFFTPNLLAQEYNINAKLTVEAMLAHHQSNSTLTANDKFLSTKTYRFLTRIMSYTQSPSKGKKLAALYHDAVKRFPYYDLPSVSYLLYHHSHNIQRVQMLSTPLKLFAIKLCWMNYPPKLSNRIGGWKESNILYTRNR